jgi:hypothetical protein
MQVILCVRQKVDAQVHELYGLTEEEVKIVQGT